MKKGFTLIELIVTIGILSIFLTIGGCVTVFCVGGCIAKNHLQEDGIKGVGTKLWNGTGNTNKPLDKSL